MDYQELTKREEDIMRVLWKLKKAFVKDIRSELNEGLSYNTVSTVTRHLEEKNYVGHHVYGNTHQYFPLVSQEKYQLKVLNQTTDNFFKGSYKNLVSFFAENEKISQQDLEDIIKLINKK
jgi:predicted transcriptional regulator